MNVSNSTIAVIDLVVVFLVAWGLAALVSPLIVVERPVACMVKVYADAHETHYAVGRGYIDE